MHFKTYNILEKAITEGVLGGLHWCHRESDDKIRSWPSENTQDGEVDQIIESWTDAIVQRIMDSLEEVIKYEDIN
jgi:hypothetical protein